MKLNIPQLNKQDTEMDTIDLMDAIIELEQTTNDFNSLVESYLTVAEIKNAIDGCEIDDAMLAYAGEAIGQIAPAFIEKDSPTAVLQLTANLEEAAKVVDKTLKKTIKKFNKTVHGLFTSIIRIIIDIQKTRLVAKIDKILGKPKVSWGYFVKTLNSVKLLDIDINGNADIDAVIATINTTLDAYAELRDCIIDNDYSKFNDIEIPKQLYLIGTKCKEIEASDYLRKIITLFKNEDIPATIKVILSKKIPASDITTDDMSADILKTTIIILNTISSNIVTYYRGVYNAFYVCTKLIK